MDATALSELLAERLDIQLPPVALSFVDERPQTVPDLVRESPSFCTMWRWAEESTFYAEGAQHLGCAIGGVVSGFLQPDGRDAELTAALREICEDEDAGPDEIAITAKFAHDRKGTVYGPLWSFPLDPEIVVMWATLPQLGVLQEITGTFIWQNNPQGITITRPACSVLAIAAQHGKVAMHLGCIGMRQYTQIPDGNFLVAIPRSLLDDLETGLRVKTDAIDRMRMYAERMQAGGG